MTPATTFRKVVLPAKPSRRRLEASLLGEAVDTSTAFAAEDAERAAWLKEQLAKEDEGNVLRVEKCEHCGRPMKVRTKLRRFCLDCGLRRETEQRRAREVVDG